MTLVFFGAKGGAGTTTVAVNCAVELARLTKRPTVIVDLKPWLRRGRAVPRRAAALHGARRDREPAPPRPRVPARARREAQVGPRDPRRLRAVRPARRPATPAPSRSCSALLGAHATTTSSWTRATRSTRARWRRSTPPTRSSSSPTRTCRRSATRSGCSTACAQLGAGGERVRVLLNRASEPYPIAPKQIETALGYADPPHVPERLQDRLDGAQLGRAARADGQLGDRGAVRPASRAASARDRRAARTRSLGAGEARTRARPRD